MTRRSPLAEELDAAADAGSRDAAQIGERHSDVRATHLPVALADVARINDARRALAWAEMMTDHDVHL